MNASGRPHALRRSRRIGSPSCDCSSGRVTRSAGYLRAIGDPRKVRSWIGSSRNDDCRLCFASRSGTAWHLAPTSRRGRWVEFTNRELQPRDIAGASRSHLLHPCLSVFIRGLYLVAFYLWALSVALTRAGGPDRGWRRCRRASGRTAPISCQRGGCQLDASRRHGRVTARWACCTTMTCSARTSFRASTKSCCGRTGSRETEAAR